MIEQFASEDLYGTVFIINRKTFFNKKINSVLADKFLQNKKLNEVEDMVNLMLKNRVDINDPEIEININKYCDNIIVKVTSKNEKENLNFTEKGCIFSVKEL